MPTVAAPGVTSDLSVTDDHSVLLWEACAYADELTDAVRDGRPFAASYDALLEFLHDRLLPYLTEEERRLPSGQLRDDHLTKLIWTEHARLRADVDSIEGSRTSSLLAMAAERLVDRLERHVHREEAWLTSADALRVVRRDSVDLTRRGSSWT